MAFICDAEKLRPGDIVLVKSDHFQTLMALLNAFDRKVLLQQQQKSQAAQKP